MTRAAALTALVLELRAADNYPWRCVYTQTRKGNADTLNRDLGTAYVAHRRQGGKDISDVVSKRTYTKDNVLPMRKRA
jgi:hypothetical protein